MLKESKYVQLDGNNSSEKTLELPMFDQVSVTMKRYGPSDIKSFQIKVLFANPLAFTSVILSGD